MTHGARLNRTPPSNFRGERHGRHKEKFYYRGTCWSPSPFPTHPLTTSAGSSPASIKPRAHSNGHNVIEPFPPAWALHFRRREEEITARLPVGHDRDKCRRPGDYPSSPPDNFQVAFPSALPTCYRFCKWAQKHLARRDPRPWRRHPRFRRPPYRLPAIEVRSKRGRLDLHLTAHCRFYGIHLRRKSVSLLTLLSLISIVRQSL